MVMPRSMKCWLLPTDQHMGNVIIFTIRYGAKKIN